MIKVFREERILRVTLNRADKRNALSNELCGAVVAAVEQAQQDAAVGSILLDARGDVFCAGMDLDEATAPGAVSSTAVHERLFTMGSWTRKPLVAAVNGPALGGGLGLVANAHVVVASHGVSFGLTEIRIGMWPFVIWSSIAQAMGERRALSLALTGRIFSVNEGVQWGLVHEVTPPFELDDRATAIAQHLSESSPQALALGLEFVSRSRGLPYEDAGRLALQMRAEAFASEDFREGVAAFREKRKAKWSLELMILNSLLFEPGERLSVGEFLHRWTQMPELKCAQLIDGMVYLPPPVTCEHGELHALVAFLAGMYATNTGVCSSVIKPTWLMIDDAPQPDVVLLLEPEYGGTSDLSGRLGAGAPELIFEVSTSSRSIDLGPKLRLYERAGVPEYVALLLEEKRIEWRQLEAGRYRLRTADTNGTYNSLVMPGLWLNEPAVCSRDTAAAVDILNRGLESKECAEFVTRVCQFRAG